MGSLKLHQDAHLNLRVQNGWAGRAGASLDQSTRKQQQRQQLRQQRIELSPDFCESASQHIATQLLQLPLIKNAQHLAYYWPARNECDPRPLIRQLNLVTMYLPVINPHNKLLEFYPYRLDEPLHNNQFHIAEPVTKNKNPIETSKLDVVLVPLLGFDHRGNRLGMGGGYYDQSFAFIKNLPKFAKRPRLIGIAYEFQKLDEVPRESWDIALDYVVTEKALYCFGEA